MKKYLLLSIYIISMLSAMAQNSNGKISVTIKNDQQLVAENATVELLKQDSTLVKAGITDKAGVAEFDRLPYGNYLVKATLVDHVVFYSNQLAVSAEQPSVVVPAITLTRASGEMQGVTVSAKKPFIQRLTDRIVVNVENSIVNAGSSAMDVQIGRASCRERV